MNDQQIKEIVALVRKYAELQIDEDVIESALRAAVPEQWRPMDTAPKDGTLIRLLVDFEHHATDDAEGPLPTIGSNTWDNNHDFDEWQFAGWDWCQDRYTQGVGTPVGWLPMLAASPQQAPQAAQPVQPSEPAVWKSPEDTDNAQKLVWLRENGVVFLGYYFEQPFREYRDGDGFYVGQQDAEAYWARHEDGEPCEPDGWCQLLPPLADAQQAGAVLKPEPVAFDRWWFDESTVDALEAASSVRAECCLAWDAAVAATLQQSEQVRKPLSDVEITDAYKYGTSYRSGVFAFEDGVRFAERAHHIKES